MGCNRGLAPAALGGRAAPRLVGSGLRPSWDSALPRLVGLTSFVGGAAL